MQSDNYLRDSSNDEEDKNEILDINNDVSNSENDGDDDNNDNGPGNIDSYESNSKKIPPKTKSKKNISKYHKTNNTKKHDKHNTIFVNNITYLKTLLLGKDNDFYYNNMIDNIF